MSRRYPLPFDFVHGSARVLVWAVGLGLVLASSAYAQTYAEWATLRYPQSADARAPEADPDSDGWVNLADYAFGLKGPSGTVSGGGWPLAVGASSAGELSLESLEGAGRRHGVQIDLEVSADLLRWIRPPWTMRALAPRVGDPEGGLRTGYATFLPARERWFARVRVTAVDLGLEEADYYVAPTGSDAAAGTRDAPFATVKKAAETAAPGQLVHLRGGTYPAVTKISLTRTGSAAATFASEPIRGSVRFSMCQAPRERARTRFRSAGAFIASTDLRSSGRRTTP